MSIEDKIREEKIATLTEKIKEITDQAKEAKEYPFFDKDLCGSKGKNTRLSHYAGRRGSKG